MHLRLTVLSESTGILARFGLLSLIPVVALGAALAHELNVDVQQHHLDAARSSAELIADVVVQPLLEPGDLSGGMSTARIAQVDQRLHGIASSVSRIKVWNKTGTVIYSDNAALIGQRFPLDGDLRAAFAGRTSADISAGKDPENAGDDLAGPLIQVYVPLIFHGNTWSSGAFEIYVPYAPVEAAIERESRQLYVILAAGLAVFYASMFPIVFLADRWRRRFTDELRRRNEAERISELKSRFLAAMSHEFRTPLNSVLGFAQMLRLHVAGPLTERQERYVGNIESSGKHLLALINDVLDLAKIEAGKLEVNVQPVSLEHVIGPAFDVVEPLSHAKGIEVAAVGVLGLNVAADERRLVQVLVNLLSNSVKFTPEGGQVTVRVTETEGGMVYVDVIDTGSGIPPADQQRVFEEFDQASPSNGAVQEGTGLGLPISRRLMRLMGGELELLESTPEGSTFRLTLPLASLEGRPDGPPTPGAGVGAPTRLNHVQASA